MKIATISDKINSNILNIENYKNIYNLGSKENLMVRKIPLKDKTEGIILANQRELDYLVMQNGKVLSSKGYIGKMTDETCLLACKIYDHIKKKNLAADSFNHSKAWMSFIDEYIYRFM